MPDDSGDLFCSSRIAFYGIIAIVVTGKIFIKTIVSVQFCILFFTGRSGEYIHMHLSISAEKRKILLKGDFA